MVDKDRLIKALKSEMSMNEEEIGYVVESIETIEALKTDAVMATYSSNEESEVVSELRTIFKKIFLI